MMKSIRLIENPQEIRKAFCEKFVLSEEAFEIRHKEWIEDIQAKGCQWHYDELLLWDKMPQYQPVSFDRALLFLRDLNCSVLAMSEPEGTNDHGFTLGGITYRGAVIQADSAALAELIGYEWYENRRLSQWDECLENTILPEDLYVFDPSMEHLLVFTHEHDFWDLEITQPMVAAKSRYCMCHGFALPPASSYEELKAAFDAEVAKGAVMAVECSYTTKGYYRAFTVCKRQSSDGKTGEYWFEHAPETRYSSIESLETAKAFYEDSLLSVSKNSTVRFEIHSVTYQNVL